jgi:hypothetical protein
MSPSPTDIPAKLRPLAEELRRQLAEGTAALGDEITSSDDSAGDEVTPS